jgi:hypothetical protein
MMMMMMDVNSIDEKDDHGFPMDAQSGFDHFFGCL